MAISSDFEYETRHVDVLGSRMAYVDVGEGEPVVFLHGNPTWSYLWRNVLPYLAPHCRCIAPDLMGMGRSAKPDIAYRFFDHYAYLEAFLDALDLDRVTFVAHDWGGSLAFHYLRHHPARVRALAFLEVMLYPLRWAGFPRPFRPGFWLMRTPGVGWLMLSFANLFVELVLPMATRRRLGPEEKARYRRPFRTIASRRPVRQWPCEIPFDGQPADVADAFEAYSAALQSSPVPKLLLYGQPGGVIGPAECDWARAHLPSLETVGVGSGIHFLQEDQPDAIGEALTEWYARAVQSTEALPA